MSMPAAKRQRLSGPKKALIKRDLLTLPQEIVFLVFSFLDAADLTTCARVSTKWYAAASDEQLWKPLFLYRFPNPRQMLVQQLRSQKLHGKQSVGLNRHGRQEKWKTLYKVNHNWETGNCKVEELQLPIHTTRLNSRQHHLSEEAKATGSFLFQVCNDIIVTASTDSANIDVWQIEGSSIQHIATAPPSVETVAYVTCIKWDNTDPTRVVAGYSNGGFTVYQIDAKKRSIMQLAGHAARPSVDCDRHGVQSIALCEKIVMTCSSDMELSTYLCEDQGTRLCHSLISAMTWEPLTLEIFAKSNNSYQAIVCFGMSAGLDSWTLGIQEVIFTPTVILSSRHSSSRTHRYGSNDPIRKISYAHPYVVTSHNNNTMQHYRICSEQGQRVEIEHVRTLWGHTSSVGAMALDARIGRLVSGDRAGIKVWNLESHNDLVVGIENGLCENMDWIGFDSEKIVTVTGDHENNVKVWSFSNSSGDK
ncbi:hypothetical protein K450DRAFT_231488 [Umbelopsis ramanniana AG]|uniref:F-box domain-containing protein n=1 Tax=Umbelopsis ramanniana AG TaxID=1314678 RepID=A0AAD5HEM2_UMBRA|nr:uncharacterized protein K450DRAFT_231488 [Umbelopsis ramanniana AG]KAI8581477.1 hypothetical protein K450DRAFT_231488 [Umbelopsis ramanniana AG]